MNKRHAKPTTWQLAHRIYRKQLEMQHDMVNQLSLLRLDVQRVHRFVDSFQASLSTVESLRLKQDQQLDRLIANQSMMLKHVDNFARRLAIPTLLDEASRFMSQPLNGNH